MGCGAGYDRCMQDRAAAGWLLAGVGVLCVMHLVLHRYSAWFDTMPVGVDRWFDMNSESSVIDEKVQVHEQLPELFGMSRGEGITHEWLIPGVIIAGLGVAVLTHFVRALDRRVRWGLFLALLVYAAGAVVVEGLSGIAVRELAPEHPLRTAMPLWEAIEESLEMLGCIVALSVILEHLQRRGVLVVRCGECQHHGIPLPPR